MMVDVWFYYGAVLFKEDAAFLEGGEIGRMLSRKGDLDGRGSSAFLFVPNNMDRCCRKSSLLVVNCDHIDITTGIHNKLFSNGKC